MGNLNPYYNESFVFSVEQEILRVWNLTFRAWFILSIKSEVSFRPKSILTFIMACWKVMLLRSKAFEHFTLITLHFY